MIVTLHTGAGETAVIIRGPFTVQPNDVRGDKVLFQYERTGTSATVTLEGRMSPDATFQQLTSQTGAGGLIEVSGGCNEYRLNITAITAATVKAWLATN